MEKNLKQEIKNLNLVIASFADRRKEVPNLSNKLGRLRQMVEHKQYELKGLPKVARR